MAQRKRTRNRSKGPTVLSRHIVPSSVCFLAKKIHFPANISRRNNVMNMKTEAESIFFSNISSLRFTSASAQSDTDRACFRFSQSDFAKSTPIPYGQSPVSLDCPIQQALQPVLTIIS